MSSKFAIGIDLGTTNSCAAVYKNNKIEMIPSRVGGNLIKSAVGMINNEIIVGDLALKKAERFPEQVFYDIKRLIGRKFTDKSVQKIMNNLPFHIIKQKEKIIIPHNGYNYTPEEISACILAEIKKSADAHLDADITEVVITVPTYFTNTQRQATIDAGKIAGFKKIVLIDEPTAAALEYGISNKIKDGRVMLIFDFGGGTFDVSVIKYTDEIFEVLAIDGDSYLGGGDIDNVIVEFLKEKLNQEKFSNRQILRLHKKSEDAKKEIGQSTEVSIDFSDIQGTEEFDFTREEFNKLCDKIYEKLLQILRNCLDRVRDINLEVDDILLVGGSTRIPEIEKLLERELGKTCKKNINPDEAVAAGAAHYAAKLFTTTHENFKISTMLPYTLGVEIKDGKMYKLIHKYTKLPAKGSKKFKTVDKDDNEIELKIFSGDAEDTKDNTLLGEMFISNIASAPEGNVLEETFEVDVNGILNVSAVDHSGRSQNMKVTLDKGNLSDSEISFMRERLKEAFQEQKKKVK